MKIEKVLGERSPKEAKHHDKADEDIGDVLGDMEIKQKP